MFGRNWIVRSVSIVLVLSTVGTSADQDSPGTASHFATLQSLAMAAGSSAFGGCAYDDVAIGGVELVAPLGIPAIALSWATNVWAVALISWRTWYVSF